MRISILILLFILGGAWLSWAEGPQQDYFVGKDGCFLLYNLKTKEFEKVIGQERCQQRFVPCSTFKLALAVMAFDSGVLKDENQILKWDGHKNTREVANHDHNAKTWIRDSIVWFSQRLTPQLGEQRLKKYLHDFHYGNEDISAGITEAWLVPPDAAVSALKISAYEQIDFMKNLWTYQLPVSKRSMRLTQQISYLETSPHGFQLSGKTGSNVYHNQQMRLGWFIGYLGKGSQKYLVVTNFNDLTTNHEDSYGGSKAKEITKTILANQGLW